MACTIVSEFHMKADLAFCTPVELIAESARFCYAPVGESKGEVADLNLIKSLIDNGHDEPQQCSLLVFDLYAPLFVLSQFNRQKVGAGRCQNSLRYQKIEDAKFYFPTDALDDPDVDQWLRDFEALTMPLIQRHQANKRQREVWQRLLPPNILVHLRCWHNFKSLTHFFGNRLSPHAQYEARVVASLMYDNLSRFDPEGWGKALETWRSNNQRRTEG
jgi:thymidylate synthase ThyX